MPAQPARRLLLGGLGAGAVLAAAGCSTDDRPGTSDTPKPSGSPFTPRVAVRADGTVALLPNLGDPAALVSSLFATANVAVLADPTGAQSATAVATAKALSVPVLTPGPQLAGQLAALEVRTLISYAATAPSVPSTLEVIAGASTPPALRGYTPAPAEDGSAYLLATAAPVPDAVTATNLAIAGVRTIVLTAPDPRVVDEAYTTLNGRPDAPVIGVGADLGPADRFAQRVRTARFAEQLPGGGLLPFPDRMMVALYGHPESAALGMLGEQPAKAAVARVTKLAKEYAALTTTRVVPAFELIATVASASAGSDNDYSRETAMDILEPWVDEAIAGGCYVVLDLQPGRTDFLTQARRYEKLFRKPQVGIALDPEWRLGPKEKHLVQIGHVAIDEVNEVAQWLAGVVREYDLPPKVFTLHQFQLQMIRGRERLRTDLDELQFMVHVDGSGGQGAKRATWGVMREGLPKEVFLGWKNFKDEDFPMLTVAQTMAQVKPTPNFVSYQ